MPVRPIAAVIAVVIRDQHVLLVRRANPPDQGMWGFPGGKIEAGETLPQAALRELREETGISAEALRVLTAVDAFDRGAGAQLQHHFILIAMLCRWTSGEPVAGDDALEAGWFPVADLDGGGLALSQDVAWVAQQAADILSAV
ncbi:NUDIX hydrolase [Thalassospira sp. ER-Se-21-Dark]|uniref:NUDIX hydrolase n=1 Tax=Thalassospira sp. ER-Se-21-Dark TaxID=2585190 RepID=UPI001FF084BB|nr:NUDIX hydrolase [Thalassospira sp. ER-Se-21-Dark]